MRAPATIVSRSDADELVGAPVVKKVEQVFPDCLVIFLQKVNHGVLHGACTNAIGRAGRSSCGQRQEMEVGRGRGAGAGVLIWCFSHFSVDHAP